MKVQIETCNKTQPHLPHRYAEDWVEGRLASWRCCNGVPRDAKADV